MQPQDESDLSPEATVSQGIFGILGSIATGYFIASNAESRGKVRAASAGFIPLAVGILIGGLVGAQLAGPLGWLLGCLVGLFLGLRISAGR